MSGFEWFLILLLVVMGGFYLLGRRPAALIPLHPAHPGRASEPGDQVQDASQHASNATNRRQPHHHGGCC